MLDNTFIRDINRMSTNELIEFLVGEVEARAIYIYQNDPITDKDWVKINDRTDKIENIKAEILRRT